MIVDKIRSKRNIEIRFFLSPAAARRLIRTWHEEGRDVEPHAYIDYYFVKGSSKAKVRKWLSRHTPKIELILFSRKGKVKTEKRKGVKSVQDAIDELEGKEYDSHITVTKKNGWRATSGGPQTSCELVADLGWTGEIEIPPGERKRTNELIAGLKALGATGFTIKSMLQILEDKYGKKKPRAPKQRSLF